MKSGSYSRHADEPGLDSCYAGFQSITPPSTQCCFSPPDQEAGDDDDGNGRDLAQSTTSPNTQSPLSEDNLLDSMEPATTESTPEPSPKTPGNPYCHHLINQTIGDFIHETYEMLERKDWERSRKRLNTDLARGRKWLYLSAKLGCGILFKDVWNLAKSSQSELNELAVGLPSDPEKAALLRLIDEQMDLFVETGKTNLALLRERLKAKDLAFAIPPLPRSTTELHNNIYTQFRDRVRGNDLVIKGTDFKFSTDSLKSLGDETWLSSNIVTACLHLSHRVPFVNTGFYIPTHRQEEALDLLPRPFQKANKQMRMWTEACKGEWPCGRLVPAFAHQ
ncbi:hypothetical protein FOC1_g10001123 [Fusarium oxysporum f. sp. cubense race 1]|uniref:Uncharacterized protein n=1 Tax=Fusarium oxysporum f. sp. cubense (strain race 1) TaxID=1229664 RepID=N4UB20_FUSC1|nr:hypothetical protein FOC1_g10001123 [Fusarium oxysporum f. sp. cubense race 1]